MKSFLKTLLASMLTIQSMAPLSYADYEEGDVVCNNCIDKDSKSGDEVRVDGQTWKLDKLVDVHGTPMWEAHPVGPGSAYEGGKSHGNDVAGGNVDFRYERLTGRDLSNFNDSKDLSSEDRRRLQEIQQKIIERLNAETTADADATNTRLGQELRGLNQAIAEAGEISYRGANAGPSQGKDAMAALHDTIQTQSGGNFYSDQAGWQLFDDHEYQSKNKEKLNKLRNRLNHHIPKSALQADAKRTGYYVLAETDEAYLKNDDDFGDALLKTAELLVDIATDIIPLTSVPKDFVRAVLGKDPMTGEPLQTWERTLAGGFFVAGIVSLGASNVFAATIKAIAKAARVAEAEMAIAAKIAKTAERMATRRATARLKNILNNAKLLDPVQENLKLFQERNYTQIAWDEKRIVLSGELKETKTFVRFFNNESLGGSWVTEVGQVAGKTPNQIKKLLAIENTPTHYHYVTVPQGHPVLTGFVGKNNWGGGTGVTQYFMPAYKSNFFGSKREIGSVFRGEK